MDGYSDYQAAVEAIDTAFDMNSTANASGRSHAAAEMQYRIALAKKLLQLKADGVPATNARDIARGDEEVASLKCRAMCAEADYAAAKDSVQLQKRRVQILTDQYNRDWSMTRYQE